MNISAADFYILQKTNNSLIIIDVREPLEFSTFNIGGVNIPLGILIRDIEELDYQNDDEIVMICQHGLRSETARRVMKQNGYNNVRNLAGGLIAYQKQKIQTSTK
ncbi:MAG: rhodanese-like domain-containing protein [Daejeonella sp.]|uniref:rhodanese-like domain-containing protein n=1 Tax=Daejeonella sp. TaxID=2805397 RepID=UPI003C7274E2